MGVDPLQCFIRLGSSGSRSKSRTIGRLFPRTAIWMDVRSYTQYRRARLDARSSERKYPGSWTHARSLIERHQRSFIANRRDDLS